MYLLIALVYHLLIYETPTFIPFSINKYMSMSETRFYFILVILSIASQLNPALLK